jgi:precorrin-2/cobalt-factor-2 C20-methyltransferase
MAPGTTTGILYGIGMGPGDPDLLTLKAARLIAAAPVIAFFAKRGRIGHAREIAAGQVAAGTEELRLEYPFTVERAVSDPAYIPDMAAFYDGCAALVAARLDAGASVAVLCEGDPFFYGSFMYLFDRLADRYASEIVPGITGMSACWTSARTPMTHGDDVLAVVPGTLDADRMAERLSACDAAVIMKVGRNLAKIRVALAQAGLAERAIYVERGTMNGQRVAPLAEVADDSAPYFSIVLVPGRQRAR